MGIGQRKSNPLRLNIPAKRAWLRGRGWSTWYNEDYWVSPRTIQDPRVQDYTNYGMSLNRAIEWELAGAVAFSSVGSAQRAISALYQPGYTGA